MSSGYEFLYIDGCQTIRPKKLMIILNKKGLFRLSIGIVFILFIATINYNAVDNSLTEEDLQYIPKFLVGLEPPGKNLTYSDELNLIRLVLRAVINIAPSGKLGDGIRYGGIPFNEEREPRDLFLKKGGACFDRSRTLEKIFRYYGFETRHISLYTKYNRSATITLLTPGAPSHSLLEVLTREGWLIVDSNIPWISINKSGHPVSIDDIWSGIENNVPIGWGSEPPWWQYRVPFTFVYGLYSRHGRFYPPYNFVPDINVSEFFQNIL